jgi:hypothetical protein
MTKEGRDLKKLIKLSHDVLEKRVKALEDEQKELLDLIILISKKTGVRFD